MSALSVGIEWMNERSQCTMKLDHYTLLCYRWVDYLSASYKVVLII